MELPAEPSKVHSDAAAAGEPRQLMANIVRADAAQARPPRTAFKTLSFIAMGFPPIDK